VQKEANQRIMSKSLDIKNSGLVQRFRHSESAFFCFFLPGGEGRILKSGLIYRALRFFAWNTGGGRGINRCQAARDHWGRTTQPVQIQFLTGSKLLFCLSLSSLKQALFGYRQTKNPTLSDLNCLAEEEGFEPPVRVNGQRFSRPPHSTTLPFLRAQN
jgi:hypothetical protein